MLDSNALFQLGSSESKTLNKKYKISICEILNGLADEDSDRLETYNYIVSEWIISNNYSKYDEFKYRITDGESIDEIFLDMIDKNDANSGFTHTFKYRLETYIQDDKYKRFYK